MNGKKETTKAPIKGYEEFYRYVRYPLITEKTLMLLEKQNKIVLIVDNTANKTLIKQLIEKHLGLRVKKVNTLITPTLEKKAIVTFFTKDDATKAATVLGII
ncbi:MAG: 50S ribosomal protein L23 [Candidatus Geothermarchaeota archaeon]